MNLPIIITPTLSNLFFTPDTETDKAPKIEARSANILGIFTDPFEFSSNYGTEMNPIREIIFD